MKKYTFEINGTEVNELTARMRGSYTVIEWVAGRYGWEYNGHYYIEKS